MVAVFCSAKVHRSSHDQWFAKPHEFAFSGQLSLAASRASGESFGGRSGWHSFDLTKVLPSGVRDRGETALKSKNCERFSLLSKPFCVLVCCRCCKSTD